MEESITANNIIRLPSVVIGHCYHPGPVLHVVADGVGQKSRFPTFPQTCHRTNWIHIAALHYEVARLHAAFGPCLPDYAPLYPCSDHGFRRFRPIVQDPMATPSKQSEMPRPR